MDFISSVMVVGRFTTPILLLMCSVQHNMYSEGHFLATILIVFFHVNFSQVMSHLKSSLKNSPNVN